VVNVRVLFPKRGLSLLQERAKAQRRWWERGCSPAVPAAGGRSEGPPGSVWERHGKARCPWQPARVFPWLESERVTAAGRGAEAVRGWGVEGRCYRATRGGSRKLHRVSEDDVGDPQLRGLVELL